MNVDGVLRAKGHEVHTIKADDSVTDAIHLLRLFGIGALVVSGDGRTLEGIISERDIVHGLAVRGAELLERRVGEVMTHEVTTCSRADGIDEIMSLMTGQRIRHIPVVEDGALVGMISIGDVVKNRLDEIAREAEALREYIARG